MRDRKGNGGGRLIEGFYEEDRTKNMSEFVFGIAVSVTGSIEGAFASIQETKTSKSRLSLSGLSAK